MIADLLRAALDDAHVFEDTAILFLVAGTPPDGAVEYAYLPPGHWGVLESRVLRDVADQVTDFSDFHRLGDATAHGPGEGLTRAPGRRSAHPSARTGPDRSLRAPPR